MVRFYDSQKLLEISMKDLNGVDFTAEFFEDALEEYDENLDAYRVDDVDYLIDYAKDYEACKNPDFDNFGSDTTECTVTYSVEEFKY
jgi:hypothetical protein